MPKVRAVRKSNGASRKFPNSSELQSKKKQNVVRIQVGFSDETKNSSNIDLLARRRKLLRRQVLEKLVSGKNSRHHAEQAAKATDNEEYLELMSDIRELLAEIHS